MTAALAVHPEVDAALVDGRPVVALESTIFSHLGLPSPANAEALERCLTAIRAGGAVPAVTAVLDGVARVGIDPADHERILGPARKVAARDVPVAVGQGWAFGATTVSAALLLAGRVGIAVFATGGIGGVHRGVEHSGDVSADLDAIALAPVVTVSAGAKVFLDLRRTLEHLETAGVPVLGWRTDTFPAFTVRSSGLVVPHRVDDADEVARVVRAGRQLGRSGGTLLVVPVPEAAALPSDEVDAALVSALTAADAEGITGAAVTPWVLERIAAATEGRSVPANLALAEHNAAVAAEVAVALARPGGA
ncbi:MAG TPA: pseudouridine-5'-phosphate glycosidase [Acidimicrobiales bacterium]|nr:pseudouridine-5'-phosphate glycosidase [Acidimicrobiales bacterium]